MKIGGFAEEKRKPGVSLLCDYPKDQYIGRDPVKQRRWKSGQDVYNRTERSITEHQSVGVGGSFL